MLIHGISKKRKSQEEQLAQQEGYIAQSNQQISTKIFTLLSRRSDCTTSPNLRAIKDIIESCQDKEYLKAQLNTPNEVRSRNHSNTQSINNQKK